MVLSALTIVWIYLTGLVLDIKRARGSQQVLLWTE